MITQIKQAAVEPEVFRERVQERPRPSSMDPLVAAVYDAYQAALRQVGAYDRVGTVLGGRATVPRPDPSGFGGHGHPYPRRVR